MRNVLVYLWLDVEDYVTPESDEPPKRIIEILSKSGVKATVKIVAEKARALKERGREDVIAAISRMDVGYHMDTHSRHPTLYEYLADKDMAAGSAEFLRRERNGYHFVRNEFNCEPSCFGHSGPAWAPQVYPAMCNLAIPVYLDETSILNINDSPYWYCNVLNLNGAGRNFIKLDYFFADRQGLERIKRQFRGIYKRLQGRGGTVSILFHVHTIVNKEFWDKVNFANGRNPSKEEFVRPQAQPSRVTERAYRDFEGFVNYIKSFDDIEFITARDAASIFRDNSAQLEIDMHALAQLARETLKEITYRKINGDYLSPSQIFYLITSAIASYAESNFLPRMLSPSQPLGPLSQSGPQLKSTFLSRSLLKASKNVLEVTRETGYIPSEIVVEGTALTPEDYLATLCELFLKIQQRHKLPEKVSAKKGKLAQQKYIHSREFAKACKWPVLPEGFKANKILEQAILQTWTLKPALRTAV
jgi:hypothetical protein